MAGVKEHAEYKTLAYLGGLELLQATYVTHSFAPHTHEHFVIGLIEAGVETYHHRGERVVALPGQLILVNPGEVHTGEAGAPEGWRYRTLYPSTELVRRTVGHLFGGQTPYFGQTVVNDAESAGRLEHFHRSAWGGTRLERETHFLDLLTFLFKRHGDAAAQLPHTEHEQGVARARHYLDAHFYENVSLSDLAAAANLSPYHLTRTFKAELGLSPHAYQMTLRLHRAKTLLASGKQAAVVAAELGFFDQSHFSSRFKRFVGVTPARYQRSVDWRSE